MNLSDFYYHIPENQIAQHPLKERDASRLLVLHKKTGKIEHRLFRDIIDYLYPGDVLVLNDTKVIPVRLPGVKPSGGKAEITLLKELAVNSWEALVKGVHEGKILLGCGITANVTRLNGSSAKVDFDINSGSAHRDKTDIKNFLYDVGVMPLPVYIKREAVKSDSEGYQTVYAMKDGAVAAPTAGLHFTDKLIRSIREKGIHVQTVTLHVGYGTFKPVGLEDIREHKMDEESFEIPGTAADVINSARAEGRRIIAVGTTVTRALEASAKNRAVKTCEGKASIFIYPGYKFQTIDALVTNFHLPKSTPMMLASAFSELTLLKKAYGIAQQEGYRFYSYGDAMLII
ncbi:MAG: tRNA preQ1(34) S-adenosylmethionine ribosyltransferase-isomerase QueA [Nitrospirae bacterium]|nr:tRNA preQ1(34) S-adenosylmethionine ribosyltransferase-isomerase QueA [Nitrospirota bacterium]